MEPGVTAIGLSHKTGIGQRAYLIQTGSFVAAARSSQQLHITCLLCRAFARLSCLPGLLRPARGSLCAMDAEHGNILWDMISFLSAETEKRIKDLGGIKAIAISHPHYYSKRDPT